MSLLEHLSHLRRVDAQQQFHLNVFTNALHDVSTTVRPISANVVEATHAAMQLC